MIGAALSGLSRRGISPDGADPAAAEQGGDPAVAVMRHLRRRQARLPQHTTRRDWPVALAHTVRDHLVDRAPGRAEAMLGTDAVSPLGGGTNP